jgi:hypothetical protein
MKLRTQRTNYAPETLRFWSRGPFVVIGYATELNGSQPANAGAQNPVLRRCGGTVLQGWAV